MASKREQAAAEREDRARAEGKPKASRYALKLRELRRQLWKARLAEEETKD